MLVTNSGNIAGDYEVTLSIDDVAEATEQISSLAGGAGQRVAFTTIRNAGGTCTVDINGASGSLVVRDAAGAGTELSLLRVNPRFDIGTGKLAAARVAYQLGVLDEPMANVQLVLAVSLDGRPVETVPLLSLGELGTDGLNGSLDYVPPQGWSNGILAFQALLYEGGRLLDSSNIGKLEVTPEFLAGYTVREVQWATLGMIIGAALIASLLTVLIVLRRRRDMFRGYAY